MLFYCPDFDAKEAPMSQEKPKNWREICEAVLREKDHDKINALLEELLESLDERARTRPDQHPQVSSC
jgi:hypothetical protein